MSAPGADAFSQALKCHRAGGLEEASRLYRSALAADPGHAESLHLLGLIAVQSDRPTDAVELIGKAVALRPHWAEAHFSLGITLHLLGRQQAAEAAYRRAIRLKPNYPDALARLGGLLAELGRHEAAVDIGRQFVRLSPNSPQAHFRYGVLLQGLGRYEEAAAAYRRCIELDPTLAAAHLNLGVALKGMGRTLEALAAYRTALEVQPACAEAYNNVGVALQAIGSPEAASKALLRAIELRPYYAEAYNNLGLAQAEQGLLENAERLLRKALELKPDYAFAYSNLAIVQKDRGDLHGAMHSGRRAIELKPDYASAYNNLGTVLKDLRREQEALACYDKAATLQAPAFESPLVNKAVLLLELGQTDAAREASSQALALNERSGAAWHIRSELKSFSPDDPDIGRMQSVLRDAETIGLKLEERINLEFALGKAWMDAGDADRAFEHFNSANRRKRATLSYDPAANSAKFRRIAEVITSGWLRQFDAAGDPSELPVFVVGMPRSGTSLVEQILSSHPDVHGAGELTVMQELADSLCAQGKESAYPYPEAVQGLSAQELARLGGRYVERVRELAPGHRRVVDKMPTNFAYAGLISAMLPNARIIHCRRNAADTTLSCYTKNFRPGLSFTFDQRELGTYYRDYETLMAHWRACLSARRFAEVVYEDLVDDLETQARRLLTFCGLDWDPACLAFHQTSRQVRTVSALQVRQPVYRHGVGRWRRYAKHLGALLESLDMSPA